MPELSPGSLFKIGDKPYEFIGLTQTPEGKKVVGRLDPDSPQSEGSLHKTFTPEELKDGTKEGSFNKEYPYSEYLKEKNTWQTTFGPEIEVPYPPQLLVDTLKRTKEQGLTSFEAHYVPKGTIQRDGFLYKGKLYSYPKGEKESFIPKDPDNPHPHSWKTLTPWFYEQIEKGFIAKNAFELPGNWVLIDTIPQVNQKPFITDQDGNIIYYHNDPLKQIIHDLTVRGKLSPGNKDTRFNISYAEIQNSIIPYIKDILNLGNGSAENGIEISVPTESLFSIIYNVFIKDAWWSTGWDEWSSDNWHNLRTVMGAFWRGWDSPLIFGQNEDSREDHRGFRLFINFPNKT